MKKTVVLTFLALILLNKATLAQLKKVDAPIKNFESLWNTFNNRYANFELKKVNWKEVYDTYRESISAKTTNNELFKICCAMLHELNDGHVSIDPKFKEYGWRCKSPYQSTLDIAFNTAESKHKFEVTIDLELKNNGFSEPINKDFYGSSNFQYRVSNVLGYLRLDEMNEIFTFSKYKKAIDSAFEAFQDKQGLIIDLRVNGGGFDFSAFKLARRIVPDEITIGHFKRKRIKGTNTYTKMKYKKVKAGGKYPFTKPIVILTSDYTASAAEVFVLLMKELPNVTIIGDNTEGIFSDMYRFRLPNGWKVTLSHQQYFSQKMENYEGTGISPDIRVVNKKRDITHREDPVIQAAVYHLIKETVKK